MTAHTPPPPGIVPGAEPDRPMVAIGLLLGALALVPIMDGVAKYLSSAYPTLQIVWARFFFHFLFLAPLVVWRLGWRSLWPSRPVLQIVRGSFLLGGTICFFAALRTTPMADTLGIFFISPMLTTAISAAFLREHVGIRRWSAVAIGFVGVCIILRPGAGVFQIGGAYAMGSGLFYSLYAISTRRLSGTAPPLVTLAYTALFGAVAMSLIMPFEWVAPRGGDIWLMASMGVIAAAGHYLLIHAYEHAPASFLAPYGYCEIVMTTLIGYVVFGDFPDPWTWIGIAVVVSGGVYLSLRERRRRRV